MDELVRTQIRHTIGTLERTLADEAVIAAVVRAAEQTAAAMRRGNKLLIAGNGGSAADAQHLAAEFVVRLVSDRPAMRAVALTTDTSALTATGNDYGFERLFSRQIEALGSPGDVFLGISTSGNSPNILRALLVARAAGLTTIGFSGSGGGSMAALCDVNVIVPSSVTMNVQEAHLALEHIFCMVTERSYFGPGFAEAETDPNA